MFDLTNVCNAQCRHCPHGIPEFRRRLMKHKTFLDPEAYSKVIDECADYQVQFVRITADGEPLLHKGLFDCIRYAHAAGVGPVGLTTNGSLLTEAAIQALLDSHLDLVDFSLDALHPATYARVRKGLDHAEVYQGIHRMLEARARQKSALKVMVSFVEQAENFSEREAFEQYWTPKVDRVLLRKMITNVNLNTVDESEPLPARWPCPHWFRRIVVNYDATLKACPIDWESGTGYASVDDTTIYDAWHSDFYWRNRLEHLNTAFSPQSICGPCHDWSGTPWDLGYEKVISQLSQTRPMQ